MTEKLKPCPFCGHEAEQKGLDIHCTYCDAKIIATEGTISSKNWNTRIPLTNHLD